MVVAWSMLRSRRARARDRPWSCTLLLGGVAFVVFRFAKPVAAHPRVCTLTLCSLCSVFSVSSPAAHAPPSAAIRSITISTRLFFILLLRAVCFAD